MTGFSVIYVLFEDGIDFYWSRSRVLEKINTIPQGYLPEDIKPTLGPDATGIGQVYWYTVESLDTLGKPVGGWSPAELRSIQDFQIKYALSSIPGIAEISSIGGFSKQYEVNVDPYKMEFHGITLAQISKALKDVDDDMSAGVMEINKVEYLIRGQSAVENISQIEQILISNKFGKKIRIQDLAKVSIASQARRGILNKNGSPVVGGVVVIQYGKNAMSIIQKLEKKIREVNKSLPSKTLADGTISKVKIVEFYNRGNLIRKVLGSLESGLNHEIWITVLVICILVFSLRTSLLISAMIPISVLFTFIIMKHTKIEANIMALSGIAIAMGAIVDIGIVLCENITAHLTKISTHLSKKKAVYRAVREVAPALLTAVSTTVISFIPVFGLEASEGKLFHPLAYTKTFFMTGALFISFTCLPLMSYWIFSFQIKRKDVKKMLYGLLWLSGIYAIIIHKSYLLGVIVCLGSGVSLYSLFKNKNVIPSQIITSLLLVTWIIFHLSQTWSPIKIAGSHWKNFFFITLLIGLFILFYRGIVIYYTKILNLLLRHRILFLSLPFLLMIFGFTIYFGIPKSKSQNALFDYFQEKMPGLSSEFMPALDEGAFLLMPTSLPYTGVSQNREMLQILNKVTKNIPEIDKVLGKAGRVASAIDPAPISMFENIIYYKSEFIEDEYGSRKKFETYNGVFVRDVNDRLIENPNGKPFRQWRNHIRSSNDIWKEIEKATRLPAITGAPKLYPIQTRLIMLQTGMRSPLGMVIYGNQLEDIEIFSRQIENSLKNIKSIDPYSLFSERINGKPYIEIHPKSEKLIAYGLTQQEVLSQAKIAIGGQKIATIAKGRERYPLVLRYNSGYRDSPEKLKKVLIVNKSGEQIQLKNLADIRFKLGPPMIKSENAFLCNYLVFSATEGFSDKEAITQAREAIETGIKKGEITAPKGTSFRFGGNYENQVRAEKKLMLLIPLTLLIIATIIFIQFKKWTPTLFVFINILVAFSGGFIIIWCYGQPHFLDFKLFGENLAELFNVSKINISVAVWVGFIALFGIATDDAVIMASYIEQKFLKTPKPKNPNALIASAASKRIRPCMMTTATTVLSLLPILTASGIGGDVMSTMAVPIFGGMLIEPVTAFIIPVLYSFWKNK